MKLPTLEFTDQDLLQLLEKYYTPTTLVVVGPKNYPRIKDRYHCICIEKNDAEQIDTLRKHHHFERLIGVGGCTAHDITRVLAQGKPFILLPTILSTSCVGSNNAVLSYEGHNKILKVASPEKVVVSLPEILKTQYPIMARWNNSGIGDLLAGVSAAIEVAYAEKLPFNTMTIKKLVPLYFEIMQWLLEQFNAEWNKANIQKLAEFEFNSSVDVIKKGSAKLSCGSEHLFFDELMYRHPHFRYNGPRHGEVVFVGALVNAKLFADYTGEAEIYHLLRAVADKLHMPRDYVSMQKIGLDKKIILETLQGICGESKNFLCSEFNKRNAETLMDEIFR